MAATIDFSPIGDLYSNYRNARNKRQQPNPAADPSTWQTTVTPAAVTPPTDPRTQARQLLALGRPPVLPQGFSYAQPMALNNWQWGGNGASGSW